MGMSKQRERFTIAESDGAMFYDGPVGTDGNGNTYPVDERGGAYFEILLRHAVGTAYEVVDHPWRQRHLQADLEVPLHWPDGSPYRTEVLSFALDVAVRDVNWDSYCVGEARLCDGRNVTVRLSMRIWQNKDRVRWAHHPIVVDVAVIAPAASATDLVPATEGNLSKVASSMESAARALSEAAAMSAPRSTPVKRVQFYDKDGEPSQSATVTTERRGGKIIQHILKGAESVETDDLDGNSHHVDVCGNSHHVDVRDVHIHVDVPEQRPRTARATRNDDGSLTVTYDDGELEDN
jgi:hypothetical protein